MSSDRNGLSPEVEQRIEQLQGRFHEVDGRLAEYAAAAGQHAESQMDPDHPAWWRRAPDDPHRAAATRQLEREKRKIQMELYRLAPGRFRKPIGNLGCFFRLVVFGPPIVLLVIGMTQAATYVFSPLWEVYISQFPRSLESDPWWAQALVALLGAVALGLVVALLTRASFAMLSRLPADRRLTAVGKATLLFLVDWLSNILQALAIGSFFALTFRLSQGRFPVVGDITFPAVSVAIGALLLAVFVLVVRYRAAGLDALMHRNNLDG